MIYDRKWKDITSFLVAMIVAGIGTVFAFPAILQHIFVGYRGRQSMTNFKEVSMSGYWNSIMKYCAYVNDHLLGGFGLLIILSIFIVVIVRWNKKQNGIEKLRVNDKLLFINVEKCL